MVAEEAKHEADGGEEEDEVHGSTVADGEVGDNVETERLSHSLGLVTPGPSPGSLL